MVCDATCGCPLGDSCLGRRFPAEFGARFRGWWESGDPNLRAHLIGRNAFGYEPPAVEPATATPPTPTPTVGGPSPIGATSAARPPHSPALPLAGELVEAMTRRIGADRLAKWAAQKLGRECGCGARKAKLNALDAKVRAYLRRHP